MDGSPPPMARRRSCVRCDEVIDDRNAVGTFFVVRVVVLVAFNALVPLMTVVNYSVQEIFGNNVFFWHGVGWFHSTC